MSPGDVLAIVVASLAFLLSLTQWLERQRANRIRFLLGEKETVGFEAIRIARGATRLISEDTIRALLLATTFEGSDRARAQVFMALDTLRQDRQDQIVALRADLERSTERYAHALDLNRFERRLRQLDAALPWIAPAASARGRGGLRAEPADSD
jgi:hypothetical protein